MQGYYEYKVHYWDDDSNEENIFQGVTCADSLEEATTNIISFYEERYIISVEIIPWEAFICLEIPKEALESIKREVF